jgi:lysophospholipase L1-like esterase
MRFVALGDSYTIGTAVEPAERFPDQLVRTVPRLEWVANLGVNGYTTADLIRDELPALPGLAADIVTLLVGVNDVVQGIPAMTYEANTSQILDVLLTALAPDRIVAVTIPDYTITPAGADYGDPDERHDAIVINNAIMTRLGSDRGIAVVDIFDLSRRAADDRSLVAGDGLHPSGTQYALWVERIAPVVEGLLAG